MQAYEKSHIERVLKRMEGDKKGAAEALGMSLSSLYRKLEDLTIGGIGARAPEGSTVS